MIEQMQKKGLKLSTIEIPPQLIMAVRHHLRGIIPIETSRKKSKRKQNY